MKLPKNSEPKKSPEGEKYRKSAYLGNRSLSRNSLSGRTPVRRKRRKPEERPIFTGHGIDIRAIAARVRIFIKNIFFRFSRIQREDLIRGAVIGLLMSFFALLQTTVFASLPPFGAVPDLMLSFVCAVAVTEGERWGAVVALIGALVISSLGSVGGNELPLVYLAVGYTAGILSRYYLKQNAFIRFIYQVCAGVLRAGGSVVMLTVVCEGFSPREMLMGTVIPEYFSTLVCAPMVHVIVWASLIYFHRSRAQRTGKE